MQVIDLRRNAYQEMQMTQQIGQDIGTIAGGLRKTAAEQKLTGIMANKDLTDEQRLDELTKAGGLWYVTGNDVKEYMQRPEVKQQFMQKHLGQDIYQKDYQAQAQQKMTNLQNAISLKNMLSGDQYRDAKTGELTPEAKAMWDMANEQIGMIMPQQQMEQQSIQTVAGEKAKLELQKLQESITSGKLTTNEIQNINQLQARLLTKQAQGEPLTQDENDVLSKITENYETKIAGADDPYFREGTTYSIEKSTGKITPLQQPEAAGQQAEKSAARLQKVSTEWARSGKQMTEEARLAAIRIDEAIKSNKPIKMSDIEASTPPVPQLESDQAIKDLIPQLEQLKVELEKNKDIQGPFAGRASFAGSIVGTPDGVRFAGLQSRIKDIAQTYAKAKQGGKLSDQDIKIADMVIGSLYRDYKSNVSSIDAMIQSLNTKFDKTPEEQSNPYIYKADNSLKTMEEIDLNALYGE